MIQNGQRAQQRVPHIHLLRAVLVVVGVLLHRADQVGNAGNALLDRGNLLHAADQGFQVIQRVGQRSIRERVTRTVDIALRPARAHQRRREAPRILNLDRLQPFAQLFLPV